MNLKLEVLNTVLNLKEGGYKSGLEVIRFISVDSKIKEILKENVPFLIYCILNTTGKKQKNLSEIIPEKKDIEKNIDYILYSKNNGIFTNWIIELGNPKYIYEFANSLKRNAAELSKLHNAICEAKNAEYIYYFARITSFSNTSQLCDAICETKNAKYIYEFAKYIPEANRFQLCEAICKTNDAKYIYYFAKYIPGANLSQLCNAICETNDAEYIYYFARNIPQANLSHLCDAICEAKDAAYIYRFASDIPQANQSQLCEAICKTNDAEYLYWFAKNIPEANQSQLCEAICKTTDEKYLYWFAAKIPNINLIDLIKIATVLCERKTKYVDEMLEILFKQDPNIFKRFISEKNHVILDSIFKLTFLPNSAEFLLMEAIFSRKLDIQQLPSLCIKRGIDSIIRYPGDDLRKIELLNQICHQLDSKRKKRLLNDITNSISRIKVREENLPTNMLLFPHPLELAPYIETDEFNMQYCFKISNEIITNFKLQNVSIEDTIRQTTNTDCCPGLILNYVIKAIRNQKKDRETCIKVLFQSFSSAPYDIYLPYISDLLFHHNSIPYEVDKRFIDEKLCKTEKNARLSQTL